MNKTILFLLFTQISLAQILSATSLNRRNFDPTELTVKFKNNVKDNVYYAKSKKVESYFNMGQLGEIKDNSTEKQQNINIVSNVFTSNYLTISDINVLKNTSSKIAINLANNENIREVTATSGKTIKNDLQKPTCFRTFHRKTKTLKTTNNQ